MTTEKQIDHAILKLHPAAAGRAFERDGFRVWIGQNETIFVRSEDLKGLLSTETYATIKPLA